MEETFAQRRTLTPVLSGYLANVLTEHIAAALSGRDDPDADLYAALEAR